MRKFKEIIVCDSCGYESEDANHFREYLGNVLIPNGGGLIGNNLWDLSKQQIPDKLQTAISNKEVKVLIHNQTFVITTTTLCLECAIKNHLNSFFSKEQDNQLEYETKIINKILIDIKKLAIPIVKETPATTTPSANTVTVKEQPTLTTISDK